MNVVEDLVERAIEETVRSGGQPEPGWELLHELEHRGLLWNAVLVLLGPLSSRTVSGRDERDYVARLRYQGERCPDPVTALTAAVSADHREHGTDAEQERWRRSDELTRRRALLQLLSTYCWLIGGEAGTLTPAQTITLIKATLIRPPAGR